MKISINCDMGEAFGRWKLGPDEELMPLIDYANVACGFHAGDPSIMLRTIRLAKKYGVKVGAHPGLDDIKGFGRREIDVKPEELYAQTLYQVGACKAILEAEGMSLHHVKAHGKLYFMMAKSEAVADAVIRAIASFKVPMFGLSGTLHETIANKYGVPFHPETFVDIDYSPEGQLQPVDFDNLVSPEMIKKRIQSLAETGCGIDNTGAPLPFLFAMQPKGGLPHVPDEAYTICLHGDMPSAMENIKGAREGINAAGVNL
ncbi:uncharacterized protein EV420DRAFT_382419 [Desarmillaria tabescens]|uniref:LamB/YcsF family protein n=1 Tax=Armillaria tabescens TaxID=1929756 RepID=A0AA39KBL4_ARMTA|nr:uncharacterized protein EV420DRAFT_382419 [Desarmillaria tabescens]KAK0458159.1 hypothetical protein EV420DRAFT_382419 [Desarmillaria tabescens]